MRFNSSVKNFGYLLSVQMINYLFPLLSFSVTARALGVEGLGKLAFCQAIVLYFQQFTDFGFNLTATRKVSLLQKNQEELNKVYTVTTFVKGIFSVLGFVVALCGELIFSKSTEYTSITLILMTGVIASVFYPIWLYQGLERMQYILYSNILSKIVILIVLVVFVREPSDIFFAAWAQSAALISVALFSFLQIHRNSMVKLVFFSKKDICETIKDSSYIYFSVLCSSFYTNFNVIVLGLVFNQQIVGYYSIADKIRILFQMFIGTISQALYPRFCSYDKTKSINTLRHIILYAAIGLSGLIGVELFGELVITIIAGEKITPAVEILRVLVLVLPIVAVASYLSTLRVAASGNMKMFLFIYMTGAAFHLLIIYPMAKLYGYTGIPVAVIMTESLITALLYYASTKCQPQKMN